MKRSRYHSVWIALIIVTAIMHGTAWAATSNTVIPGININLNSSQSANGTVALILLMTVLSLAPALLILMTSFTRIIVVLGFVRNALSIPQTPPNQVLVGLALFITLFVMQPTLAQVNHNALQPYLHGELTQQVALQKAEDPFKQFMARNTRKGDLQLFLNYRNQTIPKEVNAIPMAALVPAFTISELKTGFEMGFMLYIPFLMIDLIVAVILMSVGMVMLPPTAVSLPFKILLFVLVDGWDLVVKSLLSGYFH